MGCRDLHFTRMLVTAPMLLLACAACACTATELSSDETSMPPAGTSAFTAIPSDASAITVGVPQACGSEWKIRISRTGMRPLTFGGGSARCPDGRFVDLPAPNDPAIEDSVASRCSSGPFVGASYPVYFDRWAREISAQLEQDDIRTSGIGFHVCPDKTTGKHVRIDGWGDANEVARAIFEHMDAYDITGDVYVLVGPVIASTR